VQGQDLTQNLVEPWAISTPFEVVICNLVRKAPTVRPLQFCVLVKINRLYAYFKRPPSCYDEHKPSVDLALLPGCAHHVKSRCWAFQEHK